MDKIEVKYLQQSLAEITSAWHNAGSHPTYHKFMQDKLRKDWPILAQAIEKLDNLK